METGAKAGSVAAMQKGAKTSSVATQFLAAFVANLISLNTGYLLGWPAVALPLLEANGTTNGTATPLDRPLTKEETSWVATVLIMAWSVGPTIASVLSRCWGYKPTGYAVGAASVAAGVAVLAASSLPALLAGRVLAGVAAGCTPVVASSYISEVAQEHVRGALGTFFGLLFNAGILLVYIMGAIAPYHVVCAGATVLPTIYLICFFFLPESPQYLLSKGRINEAVKSLCWFRGAGHDITRELEAMRSTVSGGSSGSRTLTVGEFFKDRTSQLGFITVIVIILNQQLTGSLIALSYVVEVLSEAGGRETAAWSAVVVAALQFAATFLSSALVDRAGRRPLLMVTNAGMAGCLAVLGGFFYAQYIGSDVTELWWLPVVALSVLLFLNAVGIGPLFFVIVNELFSPEAHPVGTSLGLGAQMVIATIVLKLYVVLLAMLRLHGCYWFFGTCCILSNVYIYFFLPETKNRPISEILADLRREKKRSKADVEQYQQVTLTDNCKQST